MDNWHDYLLPKPSFLEVKEDKSQFSLKKQEFSVFTNCNSKRLIFHIDDMFKEFVSEFKCINSEKNERESYPIGYYNETHPLSIIFTRSVNSNFPLFEKQNITWECSWEFDLYCKDYRASDEYIINVNLEEINIVSRSERGLYYGLVTLFQIVELTGNNLVPLTIQDSPKMHLRTIHFDLKEGIPKSSYLQEQIKILSSFKLNSIMVEWEDKFPFTDELHDLCHPAAMSMEEKDEWLELCHVYYIEVFSLVQSLGHFEYILKHQKYSHLNEMKDIPPRSTKEKKEYYSQMCPTNPDVKDFIWELHMQVFNGMGVHKKSRYIHIGMDETRNLGLCENCREIVAKSPEKGKAKLYIDHLNWIVQKYKDISKVSIVWNDILQEEHQLLDEMDKNVWICDWEYNQPLPLQKKPLNDRYAAIDPSGESSDWVRTRKQMTLDEIKKIKPSSETVYGDAWKISGKPYPLRSFPYTKYFKDHDYHVVAAPAVQCCGINPIIPCYGKRYTNIGYFNGVATNYGAEGSICTNWTIRSALWPLLQFGFVEHADTTWTGEYLDETTFFKKYWQNLFLKEVNSEEISLLKQVSDIHTKLGYLGEDFKKIMRIFSLENFIDPTVDREYIKQNIFPHIEKWIEMVKSVHDSIKKNHNFYDCLLMTLEYAKCISLSTKVGLRIERFVLDYETEEKPIPNIDELDDLNKALEDYCSYFNKFKAHLLEIVSWYLHPQETTLYINKVLGDMENYVNLLKYSYPTFYDALKELMDNIINLNLKRF